MASRIAPHCSVSQIRRNHVIKFTCELNFVNLLHCEAEAKMWLSGCVLCQMPKGELLACEMVLLALRVQEPNNQRTKHMKKFVSLLIASAAMVATAYAGELAGVVKTYDEATKTVTLEDGSAYVLADGVVADGIVAGAKVKVTFDDASKAATAVAIEK
jgi:Protein of unknown function (DUF1344)